MATIRPLHLGTVSIEKAKLTYRKGEGINIDAPCIAFLVESKGEKIVVDAGPGRPDDVLARKGITLTKEPDQGLSEQLQIAGVDPAEIKTVVATHLHWCHDAEFEVFPNATILVQREEIRYAINPLPWLYQTYEADIAGLKCKWLPHISRMKVIEGDYELNDEVTLLFLPGHSPGMMGVLVKTSTGRLCIGSDVVPTRENWEGKIPPGVFIDLEDYYKSYQRLEKMADAILYGHDACVFDQKIYK